MTEHNKRMLDLYTDYLLVSFGTTTATGLARLVPEISHAQVTRFLSQPELTSKQLWPIVKPLVRRNEITPQQAAGYQKSPKCCSTRCPWRRM